MLTRQNVAIFAREKGAGVYHLAMETYPDEARTVCGKRLRCDMFTTEEPGPREARCSACLSKPRCSRCGVGHESTRGGRVVEVKPRCLPEGCDPLLCEPCCSLAWRNK